MAKRMTGRWLAAACLGLAATALGLEACGGDDTVGGTGTDGGADATTDTSRDTSLPASGKPSRV